MSEPKKIRDIYLGVSTGWFVIDDKSGERLPEHGGLASFKALKGLIIGHRKANSLEWDSSEVEDMIHAQVCSREPEDVCKQWIITSSRTPVSRDLASGHSWGPPMWRDLHVASLKGELNENWIHEWAKRMPKGNCKCRNHWIQVKDRYPFNPSFKWTVDIHNAINKKIGHHTMVFEEAKKKWENFA